MFSVQVLSEFYVVVTQRIKKPISQGEAKKIIGLFAYLEVVEIDRTLVHQSIEIHHQHRLFTGMR